MTPALSAWLSKSAILLPDYDRHKFLSDLIAGVTVGLVALPLAMAFAIASGVLAAGRILLRYCHRILDSVTIRFPHANQSSPTKAQKTPL